MIASLRTAALVFLATLVQVSALGGTDVGGAAPDVLLVAIVLVAWNRGSLAGAWAGFAGGLLVDTATLGRLGVTSLLLLLTGYWAGRYGETTGHGRALAPYLTVLVLGSAYGIASTGLAALLGESVDVGTTFALLVPTALLNAALAVLLHRPVRRLTGTARRQAGHQGAEVIG